MLISLSYIFLVGMFLSWICKKVELPGLLGMIFTGILLGPYCLGLIDSSLLNISSEILYLIFNYPHKHYTFKHFEV